MERSNTTRRRDDDAMTEDELIEHYLKMGLKDIRLAGILKGQGMSSDKVKDFIEKYKRAREIAKVAAKKFIRKVEKNPEYNDMRKLRHDANEYAEKHKLTPPQKGLFLHYLYKGGYQEDPHSPYADIKYTEMSRFFGFANVNDTTLELRPQDYTLLEKIGSMYSSSKNIYNAIKSSVALYLGCAPQSYSGEYNREKHNIHSYIHPLVVAMFFPKIVALENRMLCANIGRLILNKSKLYYDPNQSRRLKGAASNTITDTTRDEYMADEALMVDIARDPNSLGYLSDETPMSNIIKRYAVQIELWKNVLALRQGKFYSTSDSFNADDGISGLANALAAFDATQFDNSDLHQVYDEGAFLRKLLGAFSIRPTMISLETSSSTVQFRDGGLAMSNLGSLSETTFISVPVVNVKLPPTSADQPTQLQDHLSQPEFYILNQKVTNRVRNVMHSRDLLFFNINRRKQANTWTNQGSSLAYLYNPLAVIPSVVVNTDPLIVPEDVQFVGGEDSHLVSFVAILPEINNVSTRCISYIRCLRGNEIRWFCYDPMGPATYTEPPGGGQPYMTTAVITLDDNYQEYLMRNATILIYECTGQQQRAMDPLFPEGGVYGQY